MSHDIMPVSRWDEEEEPMVSPRTGKYSTKRNGICEAEAVGSRAIARDGVHLEYSSSPREPHQRLVAVRYFTAMVRDDPPAEQLQKIYLNALAAHASMLEIRKGRFRKKTKTCWSCRRSWDDYEEKESDVSLAVSLVEDGVWSSPPIATWHPVSAR